MTRSTRSRSAADRGYADAVNRRTWSDFSELFVPERPHRPRSAGRPVMSSPGRAAIGRFHRGGLEQYPFFEFVALNVHVMLDADEDPDRAEVRTYMCELRQDHDGRPSRAFGLYQDTVAASVRGRGGSPVVGISRWAVASTASTSCPCRSCPAPSRWIRNRGAERTLGDLSRNSQVARARSPPCSSSRRRSHRRPRSAPGRRSWTSCSRSTTRSWRSPPACGASTTIWRTASVHLADHDRGQRVLRHDRPDRGPARGRSCPA